MDGTTHIISVTVSTTHGLTLGMTHGITLGDIHTHGTDGILLFGTTHGMVRDGTDQL